MSATPLDSAVYRSLPADAETGALLAGEAEVAAMVGFGAALAPVQGELGVIPADAARAMDAALTGLIVEPPRLAAGTATAGVPVPALVAEIRAAVGGEAARSGHWGPTSQDVVDTALALRLRTLLDAFDARLETPCARLADTARAHRRTLMVARTRSQQATPTTFGLKAAGWLAPLARHCERLAQTRPRLLVLQFGGVSGNLAALAGRCVATLEKLAEALSLAAPPSAWHGQRDGPVELAGWLSLVTGSLGKMGLDLVRLARTEVAEVLPGAGGASSNMPQKSNPVAAGALVTLARLNATPVSGMHAAMLHEHEHEHERDDTTWNP